MIRNKSHLALALFLVSLICSAITIPGLIGTWGIENERAWGVQGFGLLATLVFAGSGASLASKRPHNPIGWLFSAVGLTLAVISIGDVYAGAPLVEGRSGGVIYQVAWFNSWSWIIFLGLIAFAILLFPSGHLPGPRWRGRAKLMALGFALGCLGFALAPGPLNNLPEHITNRYALPAGPLAGLPYLGMLSFIAAVATAVVGVVHRFRTSQGLQRQQMKLFALAATAMAASLVMIPVSELVVPRLTDASELFSSVAMLSVPVAMAIAILRYRLYGIDVIINRTLVYGALTAALLASYLLIVVTLSRVLDPVTRDSDIAVAASTLVVAALFRPLRSRIQAFIDRRFYRAKYDATHALAAFGARLRDEIDVDTVRADVLGVVGETLQPRHASVWIRPEVSL